MFLALCCLVVLVSADEANLLDPERLLEASDGVRWQKLRNAERELDDLRFQKMAASSRNDRRKQLNRRIEEFKDTSLFLCPAITEPFRVGSVGKARGLKLLTVVDDATFLAELGASTTEPATVIVSGLSTEGMTDDREKKVVYRDPLCIVGTRKYGGRTLFVLKPFDMDALNLAIAKRKVDQEKADQEKKEP